MGWERVSITEKGATERLMLNFLLFFIAWWWLCEHPRIAALLVLGAAAMVLWATTR